MRKPVLTFKRTAHRKGGVTIRVKRGAKPFAMIVSSPDDWDVWSIYSPGADRESEPRTFVECATEAEAIAYVQGYSDAKHAYLNQ